jgi:hypothetical protein
MKKGSAMNATLADFAFERTLKPRQEVSLSAFSFLFSEIVQQLMKSEKAASYAHADPMLQAAGSGTAHLNNDLEH